MWNVKHLKWITLSITDSELIAAKAATVQTIQRQGLLQEMRVELKEPMPFDVDNTAAITLSVIGKRSQCGKHVAIAMEGLRENGVVVLQFVSLGDLVTGL